MATVSWRRAWTCVRGALACLACLPLLAACAAQREQSTRTVTETVIGEADAMPPATTDIAIVELREEPADDPAFVKVVGTVVNHGDKPVERLTVRVEALDAQNRALTRVSTEAAEVVIPANGGTGTFEASVPRSAATTRYHAQAVAR